MDEDFGRRRGATIEMLPPENMPRQPIIRATPRQWAATDDNGVAVIKQRILVKDDDNTINIVTLTALPHGLNTVKIIDAIIRHLEVRRHDHGLFHGEILDQKIITTENGPKVFYRVQFNGVEGAIATWICEDKMRFLEEQPDPTPPDNEATGGPKTLGMLAAITALWPDGIIPVGLAGKDRDNTISTWLMEHGHSVPVDLPKAVRRALAMLKQK